MKSRTIRTRLGQVSSLVLGISALAGVAFGQDKKPNILVIWGDDIGWSNLSCYEGGLMGYQTPNLDSIANQGVRFTDHYAQPSCTAGRAAFITGQYPIRSGMTTVGQPIQFSLGARYYAEKPAQAPEWGVRFAITFLFPK